MTTSCRQQAKTHLWTAHCYHPASNTIIRTRRLCKKPPAAKSAQRRSAVTASKCPDGLPRRATAQAIAATAMQTIAWEGGRCKAPHAPEWAGQRPVDRLVLPGLRHAQATTCCSISSARWANVAGGCLGRSIKGRCSLHDHDWAPRGSRPGRRRARMSSFGCAASLSNFHVVLGHGILSGGVVAAMVTAKCLSAR
jgi:hypothetical protein